MNLPTGHILQQGKYQLQKVVGQGGFGITYKGILTEIKGKLGSINSEVPICIKEYFFKEYCYRNANNFNIEVHSSMGQQLFHKFKEKLIKEAKILSEVRHPNIVNVLDVFEENNTAYIAMEYIEGHSLKYILEKEGVLPEHKALKYIQQISNALRFVHENNILHLDIKPSNILIDKRGNARLIDFGVSKKYDTEDRETSTTILTLSKGFASIEQYDNEGTHTFSPCPDIYSLGATTYNLLTGRIPTESILRATRPLVKPTKINPDISAKTEAAILKAMQINPSDRFQSVAEMMEALELPLDDINYEQQHKIGGSSDEDDSTIAYLPGRSSGEADNEQTVLKEKTLEHKKQKKNRRKTVLYISFICTFVAIGTFLFFLMAKSPIEGNVTLPLDSPTDTLAYNGTEIVPQENNGLTNSSGSQQNNITGTNSNVEPTSNNASHEDGKETEFLSLLASGKNKMVSEDFAGAYDDFNKAIKINYTEEVAELMVTSSKKKEEKQIVEKRALFEEKMTFGNLIIVREKSSRKYGAIDNLGEIRIKCKYIYAEPYESDRFSFQREDNLYDIYDITGNLVNTNAAH